MSVISEKHLIKENDMVIVKKDKNLKVVPVKKNSKLWIERAKFFLDSAIGHPYGTSFEVANQKLVKVDHFDKSADIDLEQHEPEPTEEESQSVSTRDNRNLNDTTENQKLSSDTIRSMRKEGIHGGEIVDQLIQNSATFNQKNDFARQKYIKKKKRKYVPTITVLKPSARLLLEMYYNKGPNRICNLRMDSLSQLLAWTNIHAGSKIMVVESCVGLVVGAVMERMAGCGSVIHVFNGSAPVQQAVESFDFPKEYHKKLYNFPMSRIVRLAKHGQKTDTETCSTEDLECIAEMKESECTENENDEMKELECTETENNETKGEDSDNKLDDPNACGNSDPDVPVESNGKKRKFLEMNEVDRKKKWAEKQTYYQDVQTMIEQCDCDGLVLATKFHPTPLVMSLIDYVAPSRPIAIFCQYKEPLMDCYVHLRDRGGVVLLKISETWLRGYQVLPDRSHPMVNMSGGGGYLLTGTTVKL